VALNVFNLLTTQFQFWPASTRPLLVFPPGWSDHYYPFGNSPVPASPIPFYLATTDVPDCLFPFLSLAVNASDRVEFSFLEPKLRYLFRTHLYDSSPSPRCALCPLFFTSFGRPLGFPHTIPSPLLIVLPCFFLPHLFHISLRSVPDDSLLRGLPLRRPPIHRAPTFASTQSFRAKYAF